MKAGVDLIRLVLFITILLTACSEAVQPPLRIGTNVWAGYEPLYLAREKNYFGNNNIKLVEFSSASQVIQAFRNNLIDAATLTLDEVLLLVETGEKLKIVLVMDTSNGGDAILAQSNIKSFADLSGKRVGVESNALGAYVITRALEINKLDKQSIKIIPMDIQDHEQAFMNKDVDAVVTFDPVRSVLLAEGAQSLFDSREIPGEIVDVLIVRDSYLANHADVIHGLLGGWYKALDFFENSPREAAKILGLRMKLNVDETLAAFEGFKLPNKAQNHQLIQQANPMLLTTVNKLGHLMVRQDLLKKESNPSGLFVQLTPKEN